MGLTKKYKKILTRYIKSFEEKVKHDTWYRKISKAKFVSPEGYLPFDECLLNLGKMHLLTKSPELFAGLLNVDERINLRKTAKHLQIEKLDESMTPYWLSEQLAQGLLKTRLPKDFFLDTSNLAGVIFLPIKLGIQLDSSKKGGMLVNCFYYHLNEKELNVAAYADERLIMYGFKRANISKVLECTSNLDDIDVEDIDVEELEFGIKLANLGVQALLYIENYEPQLLPNYTRDVSLLPPMACRMIGQHYQLKGSCSPKHGNEDSSAKSTHWRSGHWRNQLYGSRNNNNQQHKTIWIEPMLINPTGAK